MSGKGGAVIPASCCRPPRLPAPSRPRPRILNPISLTLRYGRSKLSLVSLPSHLLNIGEMFKVNNIFILSKQIMGLFRTKPSSAVIYSCSLYFSFFF